ncbi:MAG: polyprenyl synthetase family protein [Actinomycetales bacterium]|nr:polyprenyl synthetase family protein [Actinomycetales bacterium]
MAAFGIPSLSPELEATIASGLADVESILNERIQGKYLFANETSRHLVIAGGKRFRPLITILGSLVGTGVNERVLKAAAVCELTHLATLYHDDVMDEAPLRRGVESANSRWGNSVAILTGDYLFAKMSQILAELGPEAVKLQADTFERLVIGQILETQGPGSSDDPLEHYLQVVADKTGSLIATSLRFGAMFAGCTKEEIETLTEFGEKIGIAFQLADDIIDIASDSLDSGKTPGTDLREGIPTLVTLNALKSNDPKDASLKLALSGPIKSEEKVQWVIQELRNHKAIAESRLQLQTIAKEARAALGPLPISETSTALYSLCDLVIDRVG